MSSSVQSLIHCEVAFALPHQQALIKMVVPRGTTALRLVHMSGVAKEFPGFDFTDPDLGNFSHAIPHDYHVQEGDRIEIYRPLQADPKEVRRQLAVQGKSIGKSAGNTAGSQ